MQSEKPAANNLKTHLVKGQVHKGQALFILHKVHKRNKEKQDSIAKMLLND